MHITATTTDLGNRLNVKLVLCFKVQSLSENQSLLYPKPAVVPERYAGVMPKLRR
jgi:hypothetical protein